jgi:hypothetical protein
VPLRDDAWDPGRPANEASWHDLRTVFGDRGEAAGCQCQRFKTPATRWDQEKASGSVERRAGQPRQQLDGAA